MQILIVTNMWPIPSYPYFGIFVKEQNDKLCELYPGVRTKVFFINGYMNKLNYLFSLIKVPFLSRNGHFDIIHVHFGLSGLFLIFKKIINAKIITTFHGSDINADKGKTLVVNLSRYVASKSDGVICLNDNMLKKLSDLNKNILVLPCGVDTDFFQDNRVVNNTDLIKVAFPSNKNRIEKNYSLFADIVKELNSYLSIEIVVIEIHNKNRFEVSEILNEVDFLLMTSISEGSPQIIKEAMACNTPIVSSNVGDVEFLLMNVENCYVLDLDRRADFFAKCCDIIENKTTRYKSNGRSRLSEIGLDAQTVSHNLFKFYQKTLCS